MEPISTAENLLHIWAKINKLSLNLDNIFLVLSCCRINMRFKEDHRRKAKFGTSNTTKRYFSIVLSILKISYQRSHFFHLPYCRGWWTQTRNNERKEQNKKRKKQCDKSFCCFFVLSPFHLRPNETAEISHHISFSLV